MVKPGETVSAGDVLARIHANTQPEADEAARRLKSAFAIQQEQINRASLICEIVE